MADKGQVLYLQEPAKRTSNLETDAWLPLVHAGLISLAWAIVIGIAAAFIVQAMDGRWWLAPVSAFIAWALIFALYLTSAINERRRLLWKREEVLQQDLDGDRVVGRPERQTLSIELVTRKPGGMEIQIIDLGIEPVQAQALARGIMNGRSFSEAEWTGNGRPFSKREFRELRSELLERGLLEWRNPKAPAQGVVLTRSGRAVFSRLAGEDGIGD